MSNGDLKENGVMGFVLSPSFCTHTSENNVSQGDLSEQHLREHECDLSLRIGPSQPFDHVGDSSNSRKCEDLDVENRMRKRKAVGGSNLYDNLQFCLRPNASSKLTNAGL